MRIAKSLDDLDPQFCHWLAGQVDGEGSFQLKSKRHIWWLELTISLRADDRPMLQMIQEQLGRGHCYPHPVAKGANPHSHLRYMLRFANATDTRFIVALFERYPLRSKKRRDFELWAEARKELDKPPLARDLRHLKHLARAIREVRKYEAPMIQPYEPEGQQASLQLEEM